jgi:hypothetical protein
MLPNTRKELANKLGDLYKLAIDSVLVPIITNTGIVVGAYMIKTSNGQFCVTRKGKLLYKTFTKSAALIIAGLLNKKNTVSEINLVLDIDRNMDRLRNDLAIFKHHRTLAETKNDTIKLGIMQARFDVTIDQYEDAKFRLKKSYSKLF